MPNHLDLALFGLAAENLIKKNGTLVIGTIEQFCQQLAWKALSRGSNVIENEDFLSMMNTIRA